MDRPHTVYKRAEKLIDGQARYRRADILPDEEATYRGAEKFSRNITCSPTFSIINLNQSVLIINYSAFSLLILVHFLLQTFENLAITQKLQFIFDITNFISNDEI